MGKNRHVEVLCTSTVRLFIWCEFALPFIILLVWTARVTWYTFKCDRCDFICKTCSFVWVHFCKLFFQLMFSEYYVFPTGDILAISMFIVIWTTHSILLARLIVWTMTRLYIATVLGTGCWLNNSVKVCQKVTESVTWDKLQ